MLFSVMGLMKSDYIDWLDAQDLSAPVEGHDGYRIDSRETQGHDFAADEDEGRDDYLSPTHEDCGWFGYEGLCED